MIRKLCVLFVCALCLCGLASAHPHDDGDAPDVNLPPIVLAEDGRMVSITLDDMALYFAELEGRDNPHIGCCMVVTYRAFAAGISEIWGDGIPERSDIEYTSALVSRGSVRSAKYLTGNFEDMNPAYRGKAWFTGADGSLISDPKQNDLQWGSRERTIDSYRFTMTRISTGESVTLTFADHVFPEGYFDTRRKVEVEETASPEEILRFAEEYALVGERYRERSDAWLFNEISNTHPVVVELEIIDRSTGKVVADFHYDHWHGGLPHIHEGEDIELMARYIDESGSVIPLYHGTRNPGAAYAMSARIADGAPAGFARVSDHGDHVHIYGDHEGDTYVVFQLIERDTGAVIWESGPIEVEVEEGHLNMKMFAVIGGGLVLLVGAGIVLMKRRKE